MNVTTKHGEKKIMSSDMLFYAYITHCFLGSDKDEKTPIPYLAICENVDDNERLLSLYFHEQRIDNEVVIHGNYGGQMSHFRITGTKLLRMAIFVNDLKDFIAKNPHILTEARYS